MVFDVIIGRSKKDVQKYGKEGTVLLGKQYVQMGQTTSLSNPVYMDVAGAHVVFIVGKRGCITGDTKVFTSLGYKEIKDFDSNKDYIYSYDGNKFGWERAQLVDYEINEKLIEIENYDGQKLVLTKEHPLLVYNKGRKVWKEAKDLKVGDLLISVLKLPEIKEEKTKDKESLRIARLLGFVLADGTMQMRKGRFKDGRGAWYNGTKRRVRIINQSEDVLKISKNDLEKEFNVKVKLYKKGQENCYVVESVHRKPVEKLYSIGIPLGLKSHLIRVPDIVFKSSNRFKKHFLRALFSCDGYVNKEGKHIAYYSKSRKFLEDINLLLQHFEIQSTIRDKVVKLNGKIFQNYQLYITDHNSLENFKKIGFVDKTKEKKLAKHSFWQSKRRKKTTYLFGAVFGNKITKIFKVEGIKKVYDLHVPINHSFIANGVISHNSGKSYTMGAIAEGLVDLPQEIKQNLAIVLLDTMGIYWTMKYPNFQDPDLMKVWGMDPRGLDVKIYTPSGFFYKYQKEGIPTDFPFSLRPLDVGANDWCTAFALNQNSAEGVLITRLVQKLSQNGESFSMEELIEEAKNDKESDKITKSVVVNQFEKAKNWEIFSKEGTPLKDIVSGGQVTVLDVSPYATMASGWEIKALVVGLICRTLFNQRMLARKTEEFKTVDAAMHYFSKEVEEKMEEPLVWLAIDEAHELLPHDGKTAATDALITILREGRQPGISLILATQQPAKIHTDVMTQSDTVLAHRLTARMDVEALGMLTQSYMRHGLETEIDHLPRVKGAAVLFDDANERIFPVQMRPRFTWHGGGSPMAIKEKKKYFSESMEKLKDF
ncbi:MAG: LAGLIDADG family homing endonuclease [Candidatus Woesearchaeota archaeon]